jgi:hypothetical protein
MSRRTGREGLHERVVQDKRDAETLRAVADEVREATLPLGCYCSDTLGPREEHQRCAGCPLRTREAPCRQA